MYSVNKHHADERNYRTQNDLFDYYKRYFDNRQKEGIVYMIEEFGIEIPKNYFYGFFTASYLSETEWAMKFWQNGNELLRFIFDLGLSRGKNIVIDYNGEQKTINSSTVPKLENIIYNCWDWVQWVQYAIINRDKRQIKNLQQINTETMFEKIAEHGSLNPDLIDTFLHSFYLLLLRKEYQNALVALKDIIDKITNKPELYYKNYLAFNWKKHQVDLLIAPYYRCLESVLEGNQIQFDEHLYEGLQKHKEWSMLKPMRGYIPNSNNPFSFISIRMLATCCLAYDKGMIINTESDYIPKWLYENHQNIID